MQRVEFQDPACEYAILKYRGKNAASRWAFSLQFPDFERNAHRVNSKHHTDLFWSSSLTSFVLIWYLKLCSQDPEDPVLDSLEWNLCWLNPLFLYSQAAGSGGAWPGFPKPPARQARGGLRFPCTVLPKGGERINSVASCASVFFWVRSTILKQISWLIPLTVFWFVFQEHLRAHNSLCIKFNGTMCSRSAHTVLMGSKSTGSD